MKILVDGDACPVIKEIIKIAKPYDLHIIILTDTAHQFFFDEELVDVITVDKGSDSVDFSLVNKASSGDIVITGDFGVAAMALAKKAYCINHNGKIYDDSNMDQMLFTRHVHKEIRKAGGRTPHMKKRTKENNEKFSHSFKNLLSKVILG